MRNYILFIIFSIFIISCVGSRNALEDMNSYSIYKIDSINNYYLIYARKNDSIYKIVSKKEKMEDCKKIKLGKKYNLELQSLKSQTPVIDGVKISPVNYLDINCFTFEDNTQICKEEGVYDLYFAENIKGLCFSSASN